MNDLLILVLLGIAYYIYQDPKHLEIEKYKYQISLIILIFCMYYVTVSNELIEGLPKCSPRACSEKIWDKEDTRYYDNNTCKLSLIHISEPTRPY